MVESSLGCIVIIRFRNSPNIYYDLHDCMLIGLAATTDLYGPTILCTVP